MDNTSKSRTRAPQCRTFDVACPTEESVSYRSGKRLTALKARIWIDEDRVRMIVGGSQGATSLTFNGAIFVASQMKGPRHETYCDQRFAFGRAERQPAASNATSAQTSEIPAETLSLDHQHKVFFQRHHEELLHLYRYVKERQLRGEFQPADGDSPPLAETRTVLTRLRDATQEPMEEVSRDGFEWASRHLSETQQGGVSSDEV